MSEMIDRIAKALIDADPTMSGHHEAHIEAKRPYARAAIEAMREPTEAMGYAMLLARTYFDTSSVNPHLTEEEANRIGIGDRLLGNPSRWEMPTWRAAIDEALR